MKVAFLGLPESERRLYIEEAAARRGVSAVIIEKDFWVSRLLAVLFRSELAGPRLQGWDLALEGLRRDRLVLGAGRTVPKGPPCLGNARTLGSP